MTRLVRANVSSGRIRFFSYMLLVLSSTFGLLFVANIIVLVVTADRTFFAIQAAILAVIAVLFLIGSRVLRRLAQRRSDDLPHGSENEYLFPEPRDK